MSSRTVPQIESEIQSIKAANPNWTSDPIDKTLITALINEKNQLLTQGQSFIFLKIYI